MIVLIQLPTIIMVCLAIVIFYIELHDLTTGSQNHIRRVSLLKIKAETELISLTWAITILIPVLFAIFILPWMSVRTHDYGAVQVFLETSAITLIPFLAQCFYAVWFCTCPSKKFRMNHIWLLELVICYVAAMAMILSKYN